MYTLVVIGVGLSIGIIRSIAYKKNNKAKKLKYYNYRKYAIKYKRINNSINEQSKGVF